MLQQSLLYEEQGVFNSVIDISARSGISVSHLPFWHQVTPLIAQPGREQEAFRWLLLVSFVKLAT